MRVLSLEDLAALPPRRHLLHGLILQGAVGFVISLPNIGKSSVILAWLLSFFHGVPWFGRHCIPGSVLLVANEGVAGLWSRIRAWTQEHVTGDTDGRHFRVATDVPPLCELKGRKALRDLLDSLRDELGHYPAVVALDTFSSLWGGMSENDAEVIGPFMAWLQTLANETGATIIVAHHVVKASAADRGNKLTMSSLRGSGAFIGAADWILGLEATDDGAKLVTLKQKDMERAAPIAMRLHTVNLGFDEDGHAKTGAFFVPATPEQRSAAPDLDAAAHQHVTMVVSKLREMGSAPSANSVVKRLGGNRAAMLTAWKEAVHQGLIVNAGTTAAPSYVAGTRGRAESA